MATSGIHVYEPKFADMLAEAFSNIEIRPRDINQEHIDEAIRSANLMLIQFANMGVHQFQLEEREITLSAGEETYELPGGTLDVWHMIHRRDGVNDTPVWPISRNDYHDIPNKTNLGRPNVYFMDRNSIGDAARSFKLWPVPDRADLLRVWVWNSAEIVQRIGETLSVSKEWYDAYAANLTWRMARKFKRALAADAKQEAVEALILARAGSRERVDTRFRGRGYFRGARF